MIPSDKRRLNKLWEEQHTHDDDPDLQSQITVIHERIDREVSDAGVGSGAYIHLSRSASQSIAAAGELIEWDTQNPAIQTFEFRLIDSAGASLLPLTEIVIPKAGYYNLSIQLGWDTFTGGGNVKIFRNPSAENELVWPPADDPGLWTADSAQLFEGVAPSIPFIAGDTFGVWVDPDDVSAQNLATATLAVYLVDRATRSTLYHQVVLASGPLAYWRLDEASGSTADDSAGHASGPFDGTYIGAPTFGVAGVMQDGSGSPSVDFDGGSDYVAGADWPEFDFAGTDPFSVEAWVVADSGPTNKQGIVLKIEGNTPTDHDGWVLERFDGDGFRVIRWDGTSFHEAGATGVTEDAPHHLVGTYDGTTLTLYIDGVAVDSDSTALSITANAIPVRIAVGDLGGSPTAPFDGKVDEVAVYDRALTVVEVERHYQVGSL